MLQNVIVSSWEDIKSVYLDNGRPTEGYGIWKDRYCNAISGYSKVTQTSITKNSQITYLKLEITAAENSIVDIVWLSVLTDDDPGVNFDFIAHNPIFYLDNATVLTGDLSNIVKAGTNGCQVQTKNKDKISKDNPITITIQLGTDFLNLKHYSNWKIKFRDKTKYAYDFNLYCSENGEEWAYLDQEVNCPSIEIHSMFRLRNTSYRKQYLEPLFDYGPFQIESREQTQGDTQVEYDNLAIAYINATGKLTRKMLDDAEANAVPDQQIELYISKIDNNKCYLSDSAAWQSLILSDENSFSSFISSEIDAIFDSHMKNYHFDGNLAPGEIDQVLLRNDMSNFDINDVQNIIAVKMHDQFINSDGFDYVVDYKRTTITADVKNENPTQLYRWYRLWNSGLLEHGGIVECKPVSPEYQSAQSTYILVNLKWESSVPVYNYDEISGQDYGTQYEQLFYGEKANSTTTWKELITPNSGYLGKSRYAISLTPTILDSSDVQSTTFKYNDISALSTTSYPEQFVENKNKTYLVNEVHHVKNDSFCFTRSDTDTLDGSKVQYYQYYTIGYKADWKNYDYNINHVKINGLADRYQYKGSPITPSVTLTDNRGRILIENIDYTKELNNNNGPGIGKMIITGSGAYFDTVVYSFAIVADE